MMNARYLVISLALSLLGAGLKAQEPAPANQSAPTPKALDVIRSGHLPADLNSGTVSVEIPVYTISDRDFSIPITLRYSSQGFQPARQSGDAGLHWNLLAGGMITREIVEIDDFTNAIGCYGGSSASSDQSLYQMNEDINYTDINVPNVVGKGRETCSDIYHFSFPGHSGSFVIDHSGIAFSVFNTNDGKGAYKVEYDSISKSFTITTGDGYRYRFGHDPTSSTEYTKEKRWYRNAKQAGETGSPFQDGQLAIVTWLLDRIVAPNGRTVDFVYKSTRGNKYLPQAGDDVLTTFYRKNPDVVDLDTGGTDNSYKSACLTYTSYLKRIVVDSVYYQTPPLALSFEWFRPVDKELSGSPEDKYVALVQPKCRLTKISVYDRGTKIRQTTLSYTQSGTRPLLATVSTDGFGSYTMTYNTDSTHPLPGILSNALDFWGYYNGNDNTSDGSISPMRIDDSTLDEEINSTYMNPDWNYSRLGLLSQITYPTGGSTSITYEANRASRILLRTRYPGGIQPADPSIIVNSDLFLPSLSPATQMLPTTECGGVRVASLTDNDGIGEPSVRTFTYEKTNGSSSGIIQQFPRFYAGTQLGVPVFNPALKFPGSSFDQLPVAYSRVTVHMPDSSYVVTTFSDWESDPDEYSPFRQFENNYVNPSDTLFMNNILREPDSRAYRRGLPLERKHYKNDNTLVRKETWIYNDLGSGYSAYVIGSGNYWWSARRFLCDRRPVCMEVTEYPEGGGTAHTESFEYGYDANNLINLERHGTETLSEEVRTLYSGTVSQAGTPYYQMRSEGVVSLPVTREVWRGSQPVSGERTTYTRLSARHYVPAATYRATVQPGNTTMVYDSMPETTFANYDDKGNPLTVLSRDGTPSTLAWTQDGKYPGALFRGARNGQQTITQQVQQTRTETQSYNNVTSVTKTFTSDVAGTFSMTFTNQMTDGSGIKATLDGETLQLLELIDFQNNIPLSYTETIQSLPAGTHTLVITGKRPPFQPNDPLDTRSGVPIKGTLTINYKILVNQQQTLDLTETFYEDFESGGTPGKGMDGSLGQTTTFTRTLPHVPDGTYVLDWMRKNGSGWEYNRTTLTCSTDSVTVTIPATSTNPIDNLRFYPLGVEASSWVWKGSFGMAAATDGRGVTEHYTYDSYGRLTRRSDNAGNPVEGWEYQYASSSPGNSYVRTKLYKSASTTDYNRTTAFYDGLGRLFQTVMKGASPLPTGTADLAEWTQYDHSGRPWRNWLPVSVSAGTGHVGATSFQNAALSTYGSGEEAWSEMKYDGTPQYRIQKASGPGKAWHDAGKGVTTEYLTNAGSGPLACRKLTASLSGNTGMTIQKNSYYAAGELTVIRTTDEDERVSEVFTDIFGQTLLERRLLSGEATSPSSVWADTYYLYDVMGRLVAVLPPLLSEAVGQSSWSGSSTASQEKQAALAYEYRYDARNREIAKKLPGADWIYFVYDLGDRLVLTQDGNRRTEGKWLFRVEDALGRECLTGVLSGTYNAFSSPMATTRVVAGRTADYSTLHGYSVSGLTVSGATLLGVNWWDDYAFVGEDTLTPESRCGYEILGEINGYGACYAPSAQGLMTGSLRAVLGNAGINEYLWSSRYYDARGRLVQEHAAQAPMEKWSSTYYAYDYTGNLTKRWTDHINISSTVVKEIYTYGYDGWGRPTVTTHKLGTGSAVTLFSRTYDPLGRIAYESRNGGTSGLQTAYTYNIHSWLTDLSVGSEGSTFKQKLYFNEARDNATATSYQWGGNIARMDWKTGGEERTYQFGYDYLSRLTGATYSGPGIYQDNFTRSYGYDQNGNVTSRGVTTFTYIGNHLSTGTYDPNGNLTAGMGYTTSYNLLNLPSSAATADQTTNYYYTSNGVKVQKDVIGNIMITPTIYAGNLIYGVVNPKMLLIEGGYIDLTGDTPAYRFFVTDYQGNIRAVTDGTGMVLRTNHYDPYGEEVLPFLTSANDLPSSSAGTDAASRYMYGAKEWDPDLSLYDFSARYYSPRGAVSFTTMDPLAEKYYGISPYAYCAGNPVNMVDPEGRNPVVYRVICAAISAGADFGAQIGVRMLEGSNFNEAFKMVDWTSVGGSLVTGLVSPKNALSKAVIGVTLVLDAAVDVSAENGVVYVGGSDEQNNAKSAGTAVLDFITGLSGVAGGEKVANAMQTGLKNEATNQATATLTKQGKQQAANRAKAATNELVQFAEKQAVSLSTKGGGEVVKHWPIEPEKEPLRLQFQQGYNYNPSSFGYIF